MNESIIVRAPDGAPAQLFLLFHGVGADARDLEAFGERLGDAFPQAMIVSVMAPDMADLGRGRQWFSIREINEESRPARIANALPAFISQVRFWQKASGVGYPGTALIGFSQGAIMALEAVHASPSVAGRVVAIAGRFGRLPDTVPQETTIHWIHGKADPVISYQHAVEGAERVIALGGDLTADVLPRVGHEINPEVEEVLLRRLKTYVPKRLWEAALRNAAGESGDQ